MKMLYRIEHALWLVFLATLAFQSRFILWQADVRFTEWRAGFLYVSDIVLAVLFVVAVFRLVHGWRPHGRPASWEWALGVLAIIAVLSVGQAAEPTVAWFAFARLVQGMLLYAYVRWYVREQFGLDASVVAFTLGIAGQTVLGVAQFLLQHDVGLRTIGETVLDPRMRGVAVFYDLAGDKTLRAYGTLPHPNVLAVLIAFAGAAWAYLALRHSGASHRHAPHLWLGLMVLFTWGLMATFSRTVIAATLIALAVPFVALFSERIAHGWDRIARLRMRARDLFLAIMAAMVTFVLFFWSQVFARLGISMTEEAVVLRTFYNGRALASGEGLWGINWTGAGVGNFVSWLMEANPHLPAWQYQPAHNLYLLVYTELGVLGFAALGAFLVLLCRQLWRRRTQEPLVGIGLLSLVGFVLFIALFDHFFWTLHQGRILWWLFWGVIAAYATASEVRNTK